MLFVLFHSWGGVFAGLETGEPLGVALLSFVMGYTPLECAVRYIYRDREGQVL